MPKQFPILFFHADLLICKPIEQLGKCFCPGVKLQRSRQQAKSHFRQSHLSSILTYAIIEAGTPNAQSKSTAAMWTVSLLQHLCQIAHSCKRKFKAGVIWRIV